MTKILILFAHPRYENSLVQQRLSKAAREVRGVTFHDLYELYPDFDVQIDQEQELLISHDLIVLQHPFYWYSCPPLLKQWIDLVLEHGWAYGKEGNSLQREKNVQCHQHRWQDRRHTKPEDLTGLLLRSSWHPLIKRHGFAILNIILLL